MDQLGIDGLDYAGDSAQSAAPCVSDYVDRQLMNARRSRAGDFFATLVAALERLAADRRAVSRLRSDPSSVGQTVDGFAGALPDGAGDGRLPRLPGRQHARMPLRALLSAVAARVERLTVVRRRLRIDAHPLEWHSLLVAFMPRDANDGA